MKRLKRTFLTNLISNLSLLISVGPNFLGKHLLESLLPKLQQHQNFIAKDSLNTKLWALQLRWKTHHLMCPQPWIQIFLHPYFRLRFTAVDYQFIQGPLFKIWSHCLNPRDPHFHQSELSFVFSLSLFKSLSLYRKLISKLFLSFSLSLLCLWRIIESYDTESHGHSCWRASRRR